MILFIHENKNSKPSKPMNMKTSETSSLKCQTIKMSIYININITTSKIEVTYFINYLIIKSEAYKTRYYNKLST